jgi:hypothetical protein
VQIAPVQALKQLIFVCAAEIIGPVELIMLMSLETEQAFGPLSVTVIV